MKITTSVLPVHRAVFQTQEIPQDSWLLDTVKEFFCCVSFPQIFCLLCPSETSLSSTWHDVTTFLGKQKSPCPSNHHHYHLEFSAFLLKSRNLLQRGRSLHSNVTVIAKAQKIKAPHRASTGHFIYHKGELLRAVMQQPEYLLHCAFCTHSSKNHACFSTFHSENKPLPSFSVCDAHRPKRNRCLVFSLRQPSPISIWSHKCCLCKYFSSCIIFSLLL